MVVLYLRLGHVIERERIYVDEGLPQERWNYYLEKFCLQLHFEVSSE